MTYQNTETLDDIRLALDKIRHQYVESKELRDNPRYRVIDPLILSASNTGWAKEDIERIYKEVSQLAKDLDITIISHSALDFWGRIYNSPQIGKSDMMGAELRRRYLESEKFLEEMGVEKEEGNIYTPVYDKVGEIVGIKVREKEKQAYAYNGDREEFTFDFETYRERLEPFNIKIVGNSPTGKRMVALSGIPNGFLSGREITDTMVHFEDMMEDMMEGERDFYNNPVCNTSVRGCSDNTTWQKPKRNTGAARIKRRSRKG